MYAFYFNNPLPWLRIDTGRVNSPRAGSAKDAVHRTKCSVHSCMMHSDMYLLKERWRLNPSHPSEINSLSENHVDFQEPHGCKLIYSKGTSEADSAHGTLRVNDSSLLYVRQDTTIGRKVHVHTSTMIVNTFHTPNRTTRIQQGLLAGERFELLLVVCNNAHT